jgi:NADPH:quinone reductase-like Zn-dependent oxidoreductase
VAGVVHALGEGVGDVAVGDEVYGFAAGGGGAAELALSEDYAAIPPELGFAQAAALPVAIETAARTLDLLGVTADQTVVVNGAAGGVGIAAVQLAVARDAHVIGTASEGNHEYLRSLGAQATIYGEGLADRVRALTDDGIDRALDAAGGGALPALVELTGDPQRVVTIADYQGAQAAGVPFSGGAGTTRAVHILRDIRPLIETGNFSLPVAQTFPLEEIAAAHRISEAGHVRGKLVVVVD